MNFYRVSVAPMMDWTDEHYRYLIRLITRKTLLFTEMIHMNAVLFDPQRFLHVDRHEAPLALQLGGSDPIGLAKAAALADQAGFAEINLNIGCPSERVQAGSFGACLMKDPELVATCIQKMREKTDIPITIKCRIGVNIDDPDLLQQFIEICAAAGCERFYIHARIAILAGLSPKENREIPPLCYERVYHIKKMFPHLTIILNGGIQEWDSAKKILEEVDGVMIGRMAYHQPYEFATVDKDFYHDENAALTRGAVAAHYGDYIATLHSQGRSLNPLIKPLLGLWQGVAGAREWRRYLTELAIKNQFSQDEWLNKLSERGLI